MASGIEQIAAMNLDRVENGPVLSALEKSARPENTGYTVDGYEVHVRPDLVTRLRELMGYATNAHFEYVFGNPVLCTTSRVIFAMASGTSSLALHLPENLWGLPYEEFGKPWRASGRVDKKTTPNSEDEEHFPKLVIAAYSSAS
jgi:hypothetical protein